MRRLALLSYHGCPVARLGEKDTGGMNVYVLQLARELGSRGIAVDVYTRCHDPNDPKIVDLGDGARVVHLNAGPYDESKQSLYEYIPDFVRELCQFQQSEGIEYDLIHSHYWLSGRVGMIMSRRWRVPHVASFHTLAKTKMRARPESQESELRESVEQSVISDADAIVVSTDLERDDITTLYDGKPDKIHVIPAGVDPDLFQPSDKNIARQDLGFDEKKVILYVGRLDPFKGVDVLLRAFALLDNLDDSRLLIVGGNLEDDEELLRLKQITHELDIEDRVTFTGSVSQLELPKYYNSADVSVLPSHHESFGLAALEAMACGTPVVVSRVGGLKTFIDQGKTGFLIPWRCPEAYAQRLDMLLDDPVLRETMGKAARAKAQEMSWSGVTDRMLDFYSCLLRDSWETVAGA